MVAGAVAAPATPSPYPAAMSTQARKWTPGKAAWAARKAREVRAQAEQLRAERIPSADWRRIRAKAAALGRLAAEAARFERMARVDDWSDTPF